MKKAKKSPLQIKERKIKKTFQSTHSKKRRKIKMEIQSMYILRNLLQHHIHQHLQLQVMKKVNQQFGKILKVIF